MGRGIQRPEFTVVIPIYNHERYLRACIESVLHEGSSLQIVAIDDRSSDGSAALAEELIGGLGAPHRFVRHEVNQGLCRTLNHGLEMVQAPFVSILASDDQWAPGRTSALREQLVEGVDGVFGDILTMSVDGVPGVRIDQTPARGHREVTFEDVLLWRSHLNLQSGLYRTEAVLGIGGFDPTLSFEDIDFFLRFTKSHRLVHVPCISVHYRVTPGSMSRDPSRHEAAMLKVVAKHTADPALPASLRRRARALAWFKLSQAYYNNLALPDARRTAVRALLADPALAPRALDVLGRSLLGAPVIRRLRARRAGRAQP